MFPWQSLPKVHRERFFPGGGFSAVDMDSTDFSKLKLLVIDDEREMRELLQRMLGKLGVGSVIEAASGAQGLRELDRAVEPVDLVICDWNMEGMTGLQVFEEMRARQDLRFLMLTGRADAASVLSAKRAGIPAYIVKPVRQLELKAKIDFVMQRTPAIAPPAAMRVAAR
jgi:two-component system, chemotaxis family, chemotaxis protein CheY